MAAAEQRFVFWVPVYMYISGAQWLPQCSALCSGSLYICTYQGHNGCHRAVLCVLGLCIYVHIRGTMAATEQRFVFRVPVYMYISGAQWLPQSSALCSGSLYICTYQGHNGCHRAVLCVLGPCIYVHIRGTMTATEQCFVFWVPGRLRFNIHHCNLVHLKRVTGPSRK